MFLTDDAVLSSNPMEFQSASPFPHVVIDDFVEPGALRRLVEAYPKIEDRRWYVYENALEKKRAFNDLTQLDPIFGRFFDEVNSPHFLKQLEWLTGLQGLIPDPDLVGGGLHQIQRGGKLDVHEDFNVHEGLKALRKLNLILYLNEGWQSEWRGDLQLWDADMTRCCRSVMPEFNRAVIFRTDRVSNHGHPDPLECPDDMTRRSLAVYYYVPMIESIERTSTNFKRRPDDPDDDETNALRARRVRGRLTDGTT